MVRVVRAGKTVFRPSLGLVVQVAIDEGLSFTFRLITHLDYVLRTHSHALSPLTRITAGACFSHVYRRFYPLFIDKIPQKSYAKS
jgi:hypothetical protein